MHLRALLLAAFAVGACKTEEAKPLPPAPKILLESNRGSGEAPDTFTVKLETTQGDILIDVTRAWAPIGVDRFFHLVKIGFYDDTAFFRVIPGFMAQVGLHGHPEVAKAWQKARLDDDKVRQSNEEGYVSFASAGAHGRTTQFFINLAKNERLDGMGFAPFGKVRSMDVVKKLHGGYGEGAPQGRGPSQTRIRKLGNPYLKTEFPEARLHPEGHGRRIGARDPSAGRRLLFEIKN